MTISTLGSFHRLAATKLSAECSAQRGEASGVVLLHGAGRTSQYLGHLVPTLAESTERQVGRNTGDRRLGVWADPFPPRDGSGQRFLGDVFSVTPIAEQSISNLICDARQLLELILASSVNTPGSSSPGGIVWAPAEERVAATMSSVDMCAATPLTVQSAHKDCASHSPAGNSLSKNGRGPLSITPPVRRRSSPSGDRTLRRRWRPEP